MYWYNWISWWRALCCSKHVEKWNKHIKKCVKFVINTNYILLCWTNQGESRWVGHIERTMKMRRSRHILAGDIKRRGELCGWKRFRTRMDWWCRDNILQSRCELYGIVVCCSSLLGSEPRSSVPESVTLPNSYSSCNCHERVWVDTVDSEAGETIHWWLNAWAKERVPTDGEYCGPLSGLYEWAQDTCQQPRLSCDYHYQYYVWTGWQDLQGIQVRKAGGRRIVAQGRRCGVSLRGFLVWPRYSEMPRGGGGIARLATLETRFAISLFVRFNESWEGIYWALSRADVRRWTSGLLSLNFYSVGNMCIEFRLLAVFVSVHWRCHRFADVSLLVTVCQ